MTQRPHRSCHLILLLRARIGVLALLLAGHAGAAEGPDRHRAPPPVPTWVLELGSAGLLAEFGQYDTYGVVQQRLGLARAQIEWSRFPGNPTGGYEDDSDVLVVPVDCTVPLPGAGERAYLRVGGVSMDNRGAANITRLDIDTRRAEAQFLYVPRSDTLFALGAVAEKVDIELRHSGGTIAGDGCGLRADLVHKFAPAWGFTMRAEYLRAESRTRVPLPIGRTYAFDQDYRRFYSQACVVGTFSRRDLAWIPEGWVVQPLFAAVFERNSFDTTTNNFGRPVGGTAGPSDQYATVSAGARLASTQFRPWRLAPFVEVAVERELRNDLDAIIDEPTIVRAAVGVSLNLTHGARLDLEYGRHDGVDGLRRDQSLTVHGGLLF